MSFPQNNEQIHGAVIDTGVLVEYLSLDAKNPRDVEFGEQIENTILESHNFEVLYISTLTRVEVLYIICRIEGWKNAKEIINSLTMNFIELRILELDDLAAQIKCECPIALSDCYSLAIGSTLTMPVYFMKERELTKKVQTRVKDHFNAEMIILEREML